MRDQIYVERGKDVPQDVVSWCEAYLDKYDVVFRYEIDARGYESIVVDEWALDDVDLYNHQQDLEMALLYFPNEWNDSLPTYYNNFKVKFN